MFRSRAARFLSWIFFALAVTSLCCDLLRAQVSIPPEGGTLRLPAGTFTISSSLNLVSNLNLECSTNYQTILQASPTLNADLIVANGITHFRIFGCVLDGNRSRNVHAGSLLKLTNASDGDISGNHFQNNYARCLHLHSGNTNIRVIDNEFEYCGQPLPASVGNEGIDVNVNNAGPGNSRIQITDNQVHDNNLGIAIYSSTTSPSFDIEISGNRVWSNANDGIMLYTPDASFAPLQNVRIINNESFCNGYADNRNWNQSRCPLGKLQTGSTHSSSGVGIDVNSPVVDHPQIIGNSTHDNYFEGIDVTPQTETMVTCDGSTTITYSSGDPFLAIWKVNQAVHISSANYLVQSVNGSKTSLTVKSPCPSAGAAPMIGVAFSRASIVGNTAFRNGNGRDRSSASGHGFGDIGIGDTYLGNVSYDNVGCGFLDYINAEVRHIGDTSLNNNTLGGFCAEAFLAEASLAPYYSGVTTGNRAGGHQPSDFLFDSQTTNARTSSAIRCGASTGRPMGASGTGFISCARGR